MKQKSKERVENKRSMEMDTNLGRLKQCMLLGEQKGELTIGFFGGSITQGSLATKEEYTYAYRTYQWWKDTFQEATIHYVNGGIGGTSSHFGVARVEEDLLIYQPDLVILDFSVNDEAKPFFQETYEGLIRKILNWKSKPAILLLNNVYYDTGKNAQEYHNQIGAYYGIPSVSMKDTLYKQIKDGIYTREEVTPDGLHPNDKGHEFVANELITFLERVKEGNVTDPLIPLSPMKEPFTANQYEGAKRLTIRNSFPTLHGFRVDTKEKKGHLDCFKNGWIGKKEGDSIQFELEASCLAIQYRKTIQKPAPIARVIVDGKVEEAILLDSNFQEDWGDCLFLEPILHHGEKKKHEITIEIIEATKEDQAPFYLLSLIFV